jgi:hypothetical protein
MVSWLKLGFLSDNKRIIEMKLFPLILVIISINSFSQDCSVKADQNKIAAGNYVYISGATNIDCFECKYFKSKDDQDTNNILLKSLYINGNKIEAYIPVNKFECGNILMYRDFQELLKASEYPYIRVEISKEEINDILLNESSANLDVSITLASVTNVQPVFCEVSKPGKNTICITGKASISLFDYQIKPPVKFMGLVKVRDKVTIDFSFNFIVA